MYGRFQRSHICSPLVDGAALFYSTQVPTTTAVLRQYALHYLFLPSPPQPVMGSTDAPAPVRNLFRFTHPANALDRDRIVIPAGWDSWGKIKILRDDFESSRWADAWEKDMESFALARSVNGATPSVGESLLAAPISGGARASFKVLVGSERGPTATSLPPIIKPIPEQTFLQQHYETLAKDPTKAPKAFFEPPVRGDGASISSASGAGGVGVGVVGPLGNNSFILPSVQSALVDMEEAPELEKNKPVRGTLGTKTNPGGGAGTRVRIHYHKWIWLTVLRGQEVPFPHRWESHNRSRLAVCILHQEEARHFHSLNTRYVSSIATGSYLHVVSNSNTSSTACSLRGREEEVEVHPQITLRRRGVQIHLRINRVACISCHLLVCTYHIVLAKVSGGF